MRDQGTVTDWDAQRGFGFITPTDGGRRVFVHVSALPRGRRPGPGDVVTYVESLDDRNRVRATDVRLGSGRTRTPGASVPAVPAGQVVVAAGVLVLLVLLTSLDRLPVVVAATCVALSLLSFGLYASDKSAARRRAWRVSESTLHLVDVLGGWPGGLVARHALRHKTRKQPFRAIFWCTVAVNVAALAWLVVSRPAVLG